MEREYIKSILTIVAHHSETITMFFGVTLGLNARVFQYPNQLFKLAGKKIIWIVLNGFEGETLSDPCFTQNWFTYFGEHLILVTEWKLYL